MILTLGTTPAVARSMVFDRVTIDSVNRAKEVHVTAAGKSVNAARVLHTLGRHVVCTGFVGGYCGQILREDLDAASISHAFVQAKSPTRVCVTMIDRATSAATELIEEAGPIRDIEIDFLFKQLIETAPQCSTLLCCGSLAPDMPVEFYKRVARKIRSANANTRVIVDASGEPLAAALSESVIVKCNRAELATCIGHSIHDEIWMQKSLFELIKRGAAAAVVSDGARATWVCDGRRVWQIDTPSVTVVSPIGSGDSMAAGVAAALESGASFIDAARLGVACGAANAMTPTPGEVDPAEVDRLLTHIHAQEMR